MSEALNQSTGIDVVQYAEIAEKVALNRLPRIITLCGSTRFLDEFHRQNERLTLLGNVVLSVACKGTSEANIPREKKDLLDAVHLQKIRMSDEIFVINQDGYIGESTRNEISFANKIGRKVTFLEPVTGDSCNT